MIHIHYWYPIRQQTRIGVFGIEYITVTHGCRCGQRRHHTKIGTE